MSLRLRSVAFATDDAPGAASFWATVLGRRVVEDAQGLLVPGDQTQLGLRFLASRVLQSKLNRMHLHLTSESGEHQRATVAAALDLGAHHVDVGQRPEEGHVVLADPGANVFCVIEAGNAFLAGCGLLGELACEGSREVGVFWSAALDWPLVWDQDGETAIQSPQGGTKVAWGGPPVSAADPAHQQYFDLVVDGDLAVEVHRLVALGATPRSWDVDKIVLADPDGVGFCLERG